jgi:hypothetical protein
VRDDIGEGVGSPRPLPNRPAGTPSPIDGAAD